MFGHPTKKRLCQVCKITLMSVVTRCFALQKRAEYKLINSTIMVRKEVIDYILADIKTQCERLGIYADFKAVEKKNYANEPYLAMESTPFRMMPMIFKSINIAGRFWAEPWAKDKNYTQITVSMDYEWQSFDNGENGTRLGSCVYLVDNAINDLKEVTKGDYVMYFGKKKGIAL